MRDSNVIYREIIEAERNDNKVELNRLYKEYEKALNEEYINRLRGLR